MSIACHSCGRPLTAVATPLTVLESGRRRVLPSMLRPPPSSVVTRDLHRSLLVLSFKSAKMMMRGGDRLRPWRPPLGPSAAALLLGPELSTGDNVAPEKGKGKCGSPRAHGHHRRTHGTGRAVAGGSSGRRGSRGGERPLGHAEPGTGGPHRFPSAVAPRGRPATVAREPWGAEHTDGGTSATGPSSGRHALPGAGCVAAHVPPHPPR